MAKLYNGGYTYPNGISVAAGKPLDDRLVLNSVEDLYINSSTRNAGTAVLNKIAYTGMPVIIANNGNPYVVLLKNSEPYENGSTTEVNASNYTTYWTIVGKSVEDYISGTIDPSINKLETEIARHSNKLNNYADTFPQNSVASSESNGLMSTADKAKVDNYPEQFVLDLGILNSQADGERAAARSEVAGNRNISFIRFQVHGVHDLKTTLIMQWPNGINETAQIMYVDKQQWRRNVTGATGVAGAPTNAYNWERTAPHRIVYDEQRRMIQLKDYENRKVSQSVELPLATSSQDGLMNSADKTKLDRLAIDTTWELMHMNMFTETGEYHIHGDRTDKNDGLPIINVGSGHTIDARLTVLDSSLENGTGAKTDICVTQVLRLSNRTGGDGHIYVRTGQAATKAELTATNSTKWGTWEKLMGLFEKSVVTNIDDLNTYTTNGMYSGLFAGKTFQVLGAQKFNPGDTFLLITVNGYAASVFGTPQLTQMLYRLPAKQGSEDSLARMYMRTAYWNVNVTPKRWEFANWDRLAMASEISGGSGGSIEEYNRLIELITSNTTEITRHGNKLNNYADTFPQNPVASSESNGLMSTADKAKVDNYPEQFVLDLGIVESQAYGEREAAKSEVAGNRNISFIRFQVRGVKELKTTLIMQWPNGIHETAQIMCVDKQQWRRNVTGATGVAGASTNAYDWERTAPHIIVYDEQRRMIQLKDYQRETVSQGVELPLATSSKPGLMSGADKTKLDRLVIDATWDEQQHMNTFTETGEYHIHGIRTRDNDGLPIINSGGGHTIDARLTVLDSSLENGTGAKTDICVTQVLRLSNRTGGDGHIYVRTGQAATKAELTATNSTKWGTWEKLMGLFEKSVVTKIDDLNTYTTNGMYSGMFMNAESKSLGGLQFNQGDTFLIVTVNGYAASAFGTPQLTQMLYLLPTKKDNATAKMYMRTAYWNVGVTPKRWEFANWDRIVTASELSALEARLAALETRVGNL